jgi:copper resistance protein C
MAAAGAIGPLAAQAHAIVLSSAPAVNSSVPAGPVDVVLRFNSRIDTARSRLALRDPQGNERAASLVAAPPGTLAARVDVDRAGTWTLRWQVLSTDGHITRGDIPFTVRPESPAR